jgi:thioesterase domain-containing protein
MGGGPGCYRPVSSYLTNRQVYGLRAARPGDPEYPLSSVEAMAQSYARSLSELWGTGTVHLGGWSMGGLIAYEMARLLRAQGRTVGALVMVDTWMRTEHLAQDRSAEHSRVLDMRKWRIHHKLATGSIGVLQDETHPFWTLDQQMRLEFVAQSGREMRPERYAGEDGRKRFHADYDAYMLLRRASDEYRPSRQNCDLTFVTAEEEDDTASIDVWKELVSGRIDVLVCPGSHLTIVDRANASTLAQLLSKAMTSAEPMKAARDGAEALP